MTHEPGHVTLQHERGGKVIGWVRPTLSEEEEASIRERLIRWRFERVDEYLDRIDEHVRELTNLDALDSDTLNALQEARAAVMKFRSDQ